MRRNYYFDVIYYLMCRQVFFLIFLVLACSDTEQQRENASGYLLLNIVRNVSLKAEVDTQEFILRVSSARSEVFKERIGALPAQITLPVSSYIVEVYSMDFAEPRFEAPFYYGRTIVEVEPDTENEAMIVCAQGNAGVKIVWSNDFSDAFSTYQAHISCTHGYLNYSATEIRTGYFLPGSITISIMADGQTINAGTMSLSAQDMITVNLHPNSSLSGNLALAMAFDNTLNEREVDIIISPIAPNSETNPYTVAQAIERQGEDDVWVSGFIVGSKPSVGYDFVNGQWQNTNIVIADDIFETNEHNVVFVELSTAALRNNIGITGGNNHERLHRQVVIKGNLRTYQSRAGLRNITDYSLK